MLHCECVGESSCSSSCPLPTDFFNIQDQTLKRAYTDSVVQGKITPLLKQELHLKIQYKRLLEGKKELEILNEQPKTYELSFEEILKRNQRIQQNRASAIRSRERIRNKEVELKTALHLSELQRRKLVRMRESYIKDISEITTTLLNHVNECKNMQLKRLTESKLRALGLLTTRQPCS